MVIDHFFADIILIKLAKFGHLLSKTKILS